MLVVHGRLHPDTRDVEIYAFVSAYQSPLVVENKLSPELPAIAE